MKIADIGFITNLLICGSSIDHAFDSLSSAFIWFIAFGVMILCLIAIGRESR